MKGLLIKEFFVLKTSMKVTAIFLLVCACIPQAATCVIPMLVTAMFPVTTYIYDEQAKWPRIQATMPYQKRDIVLSKYVLGIISVFAMTVVVIVAQSIVNPLAGNAFTINIAYLVLCVTMVSLLMQALIIPLLFKFGAEKARIVMMIVMALGTGGTVTALNMLGTDIQSMNFTTGLIVLIAAILIALYVLSIFVSTKLYKVCR